MIVLTQDQQAALDAIDTFLADPTATCFLLEGGAGTGKTWITGEVLKRHQRGIRCAATPTHKATNVLRTKLQRFGVPWCRGYDAYGYRDGDVITGTTAALVGISPIVDDEQNATEVKFGKTGKGLLSKVTPDLLVIDEVSMLSWRDMSDLLKRAKQTGMHVIVVGDQAQLPPVKQVAIPFDRFTHKAQLRQIVRQAEGSAIIQVAWAIRDGQPWRGIAGAGLERTDHLTQAFLERVKIPGERPEEDREVFIGYRNRRVDEVQNAACDKLYHHSGGDFAAGELVLSESNFYGGATGKQLLCANQDELVVKAFYPDERDKETGVPVLLRHRARGGSFRASYLSATELANPEHPYNVHLRDLAAAARKLQEDFKGMPNGDSRKWTVDAERKRAWVEFFKWKDQTILSFRHPFACTSHKAQGSTYREVFADVADLAKFSQNALYVAVTRPSTSLVVQL
jgi:exodeoxyribonuclease-5